MKNLGVLIFIAAILFGRCDYGADNYTTELDVWKYYDSIGISGTFVSYDVGEDQYSIYNSEAADQYFLPASTFKIPNTLIALETGVIPDANFSLTWDSIPRRAKAWNQDTDLRMAFQNSTYWYYQEIARRIGEGRMQFWLDTLRYGNQNMEGGLDQFWLEGDLRITPVQQVEFLTGLAQNNLPFSQRSVDILKDVMLYEQTRNYILRAKTGWGFQDSLDIGWFVGYVETANDTFVFANCLYQNNPDNQKFGKGRIDIVYQVLEQEGIINPKNER